MLEFNESVEVKKLLQSIAVKLQSVGGKQLSEQERPAQVDRSGWSHTCTPPAQDTQPHTSRSPVDERKRAALLVLELKVPAHG